MYHRPHFSQSQGTFGVTIISVQYLLQYPTQILQQKFATLTCFCTELSSTDVCKGLMRDVMKTVQSISRDFKMAEDSQWELLDKCITQYLSIYQKSDSKAKSTMIDDISATRSVVRTLCRFVSMLIERKQLLYSVCSSPNSTLLSKARKKS